MWNHFRPGGAILVALAVAGCDQTPVGPSLEADASESTIAASAVLDSWDLLTEAEEVQIAALEMLVSQGGDPAADALIFEAGSLEAYATAASEGGDPEVAEVFSAWASDAYLQVALNVLGNNVATDAVSNVESAVNSVDAAVGGLASVDARASIDRARTLSDRARVADSRGDHVSALRDAAAASDELRHIRPGDRAKHYVATALRLLAKAKELAGPDATGQIHALIQQAEAHCDHAVRALESGDWEIAVREAQKCASLSRRVIALLSGGIPDDRLENHAIAVVDHAQDLFNRAVALAGDDPPPEVAAALTRAGEALNLAKEALANEHWREAVRLGHQSAAISRRVIGFLSDDRPSDGLQARAEAAVQHAKQVFERAEALVGDEPRPEVVTALGNARELIAEADAALAESSWRRAIAKAHEALGILYHLIRVLS